MIRILAIYKFQVKNSFESRYILESATIFRCHGSKVIQKLPYRSQCTVVGRGFFRESQEARLNLLLETIKTFLRFLRPSAKG